MSMNLKRLNLQYFVEHILYADICSFEIYRVPHKKPLSL